MPPNDAPQVASSEAERKTVFAGEKRSADTTNDPSGVDAEELCEEADDVGAASEWLHAMMADRATASTTYCAARESVMLHGNGRPNGACSLAKGDDNAGPFNLQAGLLRL